SIGAWVLLVIVWALGGFLPFLSNLVEFRYLMAPVTTLCLVAAVAHAWRGVEARGTAPAGAVG
ncbi:MAG: hypothetical protein AAFZ09_08165, partial [Pseudomonadota bacterium]